MRFLLFVSFNLVCTCFFSIQLDRAVRSSLCAGRVRGRVNGAVMAMYLMWRLTRVHQHHIVNIIHCRMINLELVKNIRRFAFFMYLYLLDLFQAAYGTCNQQYYVCSYGEWIEQQCDYGLVFDARSGSCLYSTLVSSCQTSLYSADDEVSSNCVEGAQVCLSVFNVLH